MRRLYLPTIVIAALAAWLSWRGWEILGQSGVARSVNAGRFELAGPVVLGFVAAVCVIEQIWPAQRRPVLARGQHPPVRAQHPRRRPDVAALPG
jgi:hypothetical protein